MLTNEQKKTTIINETTIIGNVVRVISKDNTVCFVTVATSNSVTHKTDFPRIIIFDPELIRVVVTTIHKGDRIEARCEVTTSKNYPEISLVCKELHRESSRVEAAFSQSDYNSDVNECLLCGEIHHQFVANPNCQIVSMTVGTEDGRIAFPDVVCFGNIAQRVREYKNGDKLQILAYIQTKIRNENGERQYFQSVVAQNIKKID